jgi:hypothetical protein
MASKRSKPHNDVMTRIPSGRTTQQAATLIYQVLARQSAPRQRAPGFMAPNRDNYDSSHIFKLIPNWCFIV